MKPILPMRGLGLLALSMLTACAQFGNQAPLDAPTAYSMPQGSQPQAAKADWWLGLGDSMLNRLMAQTLASSPDLRAARARFAQAQAQLGITEAADKTQIGLVGQGVGAYVAPKPTATYGHPDHTLWLANVALQGSWSFDFWGKNRAQVAAAIGQRQAAVYEAEQIRLTLAQAVAAQYFAWQAVNEQQRLLQQRIEAAAESEKILKQRIRAQLLPASAAYPAEQAQQLLQAQQLVLARNAARIRHSLAVLSGQAPNALDGQTPAVQGSPPVFSAGNIKADLLGKRPDIAAQRALLQSRWQNIQAAKAEFYPNIELKLLAGFAHIDAFNLLSGSNSGMLGIVPAINLPIFTSGALQSKLAYRNAEYNQQVALYDQTVLNAMRAAADAVSDYQTLQAQALLQQRAALTSAKNAAAARRRVAAQIDNPLAYLQKQDEALQQAAQAVQVQSDFLVAWSNVHAQLGGGFKAE